MTVEIHLTEWSDGWNWTVFDYDPDYQSTRVEGVLVPYLGAEWSESGRQPTRGQALRRALIETAQHFSPTGGMTVVVPLADAAVMALEIEAARVGSVTPEKPVQGAEED